MPGADPGPSRALPGVSAAPVATPSPNRMRDRYDLIVVGTSFSASFFLHRYLARSPAGARVLVLERGAMNTHRWQLDGGRQKLTARAYRSIVNRNPEKEWVFLHTFGGNSNCWYACTPRMLPDDFRLRSRFGVGVDWPVGYDELEPYYARAEWEIGVSGDDHDGSFAGPRSRPPSAAPPSRAA